jgi:hypothetical protein
MPERDFLHKDAETKLSGHYIAAGAVCRLLTNSEHVLKAASDAFLPIESPVGSVDFSMRFWVDSAAAIQDQRPKPYLRGLDNLVFIGIDAQSSILANLRTRHVIGRFSIAVANDTVYWRTVIFPMLLSVLAASVGVVELHAACVARNELGLILVGPTRSGKSTLAKTLTDAGFGLLSDDRTFCSVNHGKLLAWGLPRPLKLRREAASWFQELHDREPPDFQNGERVFHFEPRMPRVRNCEPRLLVYLERQRDDRFDLKPIESSQVRSCIEKDLLAEAPEAIRKQSKALDELLSLPCCLLRYGGRPQVIAEQLADSFLNLSECRL